MQSDKKNMKIIKVRKDLNHRKKEKERRTDRNKTKNNGKNEINDNKQTLEHKGKKKRKCGIRYVKTQRKYKKDN